MGIHVRRVAIRSVRNTGFKSETVGLCRPRRPHF